MHCRFQLIKVDVLNKTMTFWSEDNYYPGEPVFVADPEGTKEDDGTFLSVYLSIFGPASGALVIALCWNSPGCEFDPGTCLSSWDLFPSRPYI